MKKYCYVLYDDASPQDIIGVFETRNGMHKYLTKEYYGGYIERDYGKVEIYDDNYCKIKILNEDKDLLESFHYYVRLFIPKGEQ